MLINKLFQTSGSPYRETPLHWAITLSPSITMIFLREFKGFYLHCRSLRIEEKFSNLQKDLVNTVRVSLKQKPAKHQNQNNHNRRPDMLSGEIIKKLNSST